MNGPENDHGEYDALAVGWALHTLEPDEEQRLLDHLPGCSRCATVIEETTATMADLADAVPPSDPPSQLKDRIMSQVRSEVDPLAPQDERGAEAADHPDREDGSAPPEGTPDPSDARAVAPPPSARDSQQHGRHSRVRRAGPPSWRRTGTMLTAMAAMLVLIVGLVVWNVQLRGDRNQSQTTASQYRSAVQQLMTPGAHLARLTTPDGAAVGAVVIDAKGLSVVSTSMPSNNAADSVYVLWGMQSASSTPKALGTFDVTTTKVDVAPVRSTDGSGTGFRLYAVSKEKGRSAPAKPSRVMASGKAV